MSNVYLGIFAGVAAVVCSVGPAQTGVLAADPAATLKAGFAERDITPDLGMEQPGGYRKAYHRSFHDPCKVRAAVFDDGKTRIALVGVDAGFVYRPLVLAAKKAIQQQCGLPPEAVLIGASHSHSAGPLGIVQPGQYDHASPLVRRLAYEKSACADPRYVDRVEKAIVATVCDADSSRQEARCGVGRGIEDKVAFNRRLRLKDGHTYTHPGQNNPEIIGYAGPTDPSVNVLGAWSQQGKMLGCVVNYACHATTSPGGSSASYVYYLEQTIRGCMGQECIVVFLQGFSGDVTQVDNLNPNANPGPEDWARLVGGRIGAEAVKVLLTMARGEMTPVVARSRLLQIKRRLPSPERVRRCYELVQKDPEEVGQSDWDFAKEIVLLDALLAKWPVEDVEVQAIQIGPAAFLANPAEMFCQYGLDLKAKCRFPFTFPVGYANGFVAYVPTPEAFGKHGGGYETRLTSATNLEVTAGQQIMDASLELAAQLTPGPSPTHPKAQPFRGKARYVPPELK